LKTTRYCSHGGYSRRFRWSKKEKIDPIYIYIYWPTTNARAYGFVSGRFINRPSTTLIMTTWPDGKIRFSCVKLAWYRACCFSGNGSFTIYRWSRFVYFGTPKSYQNKTKKNNILPSRSARRAIRFVMRTTFHSDRFSYTILRPKKSHTRVVQANVILSRNSPNVVLDDRPFSAIKREYRSIARATGRFRPFSNNFSPP